MAEKPSDAGGDGRAAEDEEWVVVPDGAGCVEIWERLSERRQLDEE